jgi:hypothetical protein
MSEQFYYAFGHTGPVRLSEDESAECFPYRTKSPAWFAARESPSAAFGRNQMEVA